MSGSPPAPRRPQSPNPSSDRGAHEKRQRLCPSTSPSFNDSSTADVILRIHPEENDAVSTYVHLHSPVLRRSKYFDTLLSSRWLHTTTKEATLTLAVSPLTGSVQNHLTVIELLYTSDFSTTITTASAAISLLPIALNLLFEDCVTACVKFLECIPWSEDEERAILSFAPSLKLSESEELLARVSPIKAKCDEDMLYELVIAAIHSNGNMAFAKAFVAKMLRELASREVVKRVLDRAFLMSFKVVRECLEEYGSPDFRGDNNETEAIQRVHLHSAMKNGRSLLWLVERMIELGVAEMAVVEWGDDQGSFTADLQRAFRDEAWRNIVPGLPAVVLRCTCKLANAVATGSILAPRQVRMKLVKEWLPVLTVCKDNVSPIMSNYKSLYLELEEEFLKIISTLPMSDSQELLQQCLSFSTRNIDECSHLVTAFNTWFRRAKQPPLRADNHP